MKQKGSLTPCVIVLIIFLWSGDAGVETAEEAVEPADPDINDLCTDMFGKMALFLQGELTGVLTLSVFDFSLFT